MSLGLRYVARLPRSSTRLVVSALTALLIAGPFAFSSEAQAPSGAATCVVDEQVADIGAGWESIRAPKFPAGDPVIRDFDVNPINPLNVFITNGTVVMRSADGGCRWSLVFSLELVPSGFTFGSTDSRISDVMASSNGWVYLGIAQGETIPHIAYSDDGGETWDVGSGLEQVQGHPVQIVSAPALPGVVYALINAGASSSLGATAETASTVVSSSDGGQNWIKNPTFVGPGALELPIVGKVQEVDQGFDGIAVNNANPSDVWIYGGGGARHSTDAAQSFDPAPGVEGAIGAVDVASDGGPARVVAGSAIGPTRYMSYDGGQTFSAVSSPGVIQSVAPGYYPQQFFLSTDAGLYRIDGSQQIDISPPGRAGMAPIETVYTAQTASLYARTNDELLRKTEMLVNLPPPEFKFGFIPVGDLKDMKKRGELGLLTPELYKTEMKRGRRKAVQYDLKLPETPTPLDVFFLIDVSGSMQEEINGIRAAMGTIAQNLDDAVGDVHFGVGEYRSFNDDPGYNRVLDLTPPGDRLEDALDSLEARGGGDETQLEALYQVATGEGHEGAGYIDPGQQTNWRPGTLRVVIHVTDEPFSEGGPHPAYLEVIDALNLDEARQVGLAIQDVVQNVTGGGPVQLERVPETGLRKVAEGTGATAPPEGVDCNGDETSDIAYGDPIVCIIDPSRSHEASVMSPAIVNMLKALKDIGSVDLRTKDKTGDTISESAVVHKIEPPVHPGIDFKQPQVLGFTVTYVCPPVEETRTFDIKLVATDEGRPLARADAAVTCTAPKKHEPKPPAPLLLLPPIVPPLVRPPQPAPEPNPNPQQQPASQPASQTQGAFAAQEQEQPQLAFASSGVLDEEIAAERVEEYQMSRYRSKPQESGADLLYMAAAMSMAFTFGCAQLSRQRVRTAKARR